MGYSEASSRQVILHRDGTVTYWSLTENQRIFAAEQVPEKDLERMPQADRNRIVKHLQRPKG